MKDKRSHSALEASKDMAILRNNRYLIHKLGKNKRFVNRRMTHPAEREQIVLSHFSNDNFH